MPFMLHVVSLNKKIKFSVFLNNVCPKLMICGVNMKMKLLRNPSKDSNNLSYVCLFKTCQPFWRLQVYYVLQNRKLTFPHFRDLFLYLSEVQQAKFAPKWAIHLQGPSQKFVKEGGKPAEDINVASLEVGVKRTLEKMAAPNTPWKARNGIPLGCYCQNIQLLLKYWGNIRNIIKDKKKICYGVVAPHLSKCLLMYHVLHYPINHLIVAQAED